MDFRLLAYSGILSIVAFLGGYLFHAWERRRWARRIVRKLEQEDSRPWISMSWEPGKGIVMKKLPFKEDSSGETP